MRTTIELENELAEIARVRSEIRSTPNSNVFEFPSGLLRPKEGAVPPAKRLKDIFVRDDYEPIELLHAFVCTLMGLALLNPAVNTYDEAPDLYAAAAALAPEWAWGAYIAGVGIGQIVGLLFQANELRRSAAFFGIVFWFFTLGAVFNAPKAAYTAAPVAYTSLLLLATWVYLRLSVERAWNSGS